MRDLPETDYWQAFQSKSTGILTWPRLDALWSQIGGAPTGWYIYELSGDTPTQPVEPQDLQAFLVSAKSFAQARTHGSHCGCVYVDDPDIPTFVRIFDPKNMGAACGGSGTRIYPKWTLSRLRPEALPPTPSVQPKKGWVNAVLGR